MNPGVHEQGQVPEPEDRGVRERAGGYSGPSGASPEEQPHAT